MPSTPLLAAILLLQTASTTVSAEGAFAQSTSFARDSIAASASAAGNLQADVPSVAGDFGIGVFAGILVGFAGPYIFGGLGQNLGLTVFIASPAIVGMTLPTLTKHTSPPRLTPGTPHHGSQYQYFYEAAYRSRLSMRRKQASILGSYLGTALVVGGFVWWFFATYD